MATKDEFYRALGRAGRKQALAKLNVLYKKVENGLHDRESCEFQRLGLIAQGLDSGAAIVDLFREEDSREMLVKELFSKPLGELTRMRTLSSCVGDILMRACDGRFFKLGTDIAQAEKYLEDMLISLAEGACEELLTRTAKEDQDVRDFYQGETVEDLTDYIILTDARIIGEGGYATVWSATFTRPNVPPRQVAVKVLRVFQSTLNDQKKLNQIRRRHRREIKVWSGLHHKNIIPLLGLTHKFNDCPLPSMVSPLMSGGNLHDYLLNTAQILSLGDRFNTLTEIIDGLSYLHSQSVIHGDLSSLNVLMNDKKAYLTDFGLSKIISEFADNSYMTSTVACNALWAAPELIRTTYDIESNERRIETTKACDIYSYGCIVQEVITGQLPYAGLHEVTIMLRKMQGVPSTRPSHAPLLTDGIWSFIELCWRNVPENRPEATQVARKLRELLQNQSEEALEKTLDA